MGLAGPNEPFGEPLSNVEVYDATMLSEVDLLCLPMDEVEATPHLAIALLGALASLLRQADALIALLALRRIDERVKGFLEFLAFEYGQPCEDGLCLNLRLTH